MSDHRLFYKGLSCARYIAICVLFITGLGIQTILASQSYDDIIVSVESVPTGESIHGYAEYRFSVTNISETKPHHVMLFMPANSYSSGDSIRKITRSVVISPASSVDVSIFQPPLSADGDGLGVVIDGETQRENVHLDTSSHCQYGFGFYPGGRSRDSFCVYLSRNVSYDDFQNGFENIFPPPSGIRYRHPGSEEQNFIKSESPVVGWSSNWLAYSRYDGIVISSVDIQSMPASVRSALFRYIQCGGSLLIMGQWNPPESWYSNKVVFGALDIYYSNFGVCVISNKSDISDWEADIWNKLISDVWNPSSSQLRNTTSVSDANRRFPVIANLTIPVRGLFALVLIFTIVIGPVNLFILSLKKRRIWMLWTVPLISIAASLVVFLYSFLAEGWKGHIRTDSITILDENSQMATTISLNAFYSPLTPRDGLHFSYETEVTPIGLEGWRGGRARTIDWTNDQHLATGWVAARVPAHFLVRKSQMRRERLKATRTEDGQIAILNGLGADIRQLWFADEHGKIHTTENIIAGAKIILTDTGHSLSHEISADIWRKIYGSDWLRNSQQIIKEPKSFLKPDSYIALLEDSLFIEQALNNPKSRNFRSVVFGILRGSSDAS